ncbi:MAG TPA: DUF6350 family protein [Micromonosporaceae bacterium]|nr:DUF6350 family protein [Micromonosporaceae bacterium]
MAPTPDEPVGAPPVDHPDTSDEASGRATVVLPVQRRSEPALGATQRRAPLPVVAGVNAGWAALLSFLPVAAIACAVTLPGPGRAAFGATVRYSLAGWLLGHGVPLRVGGQPIALVPLAVTAFAVWRCVRAGRNTVRSMGARRADSPRSALAAAALVGCVYGVLGAIAALIARGPGLDVEPLRAGVTLAVFGLVASFAGGWARSRVARRWWMRVPRVVRDGLRTGIVGALLFLAVGAAAVGASIATSGSTATAMLRNMHLGFAGQAGIVLVCLAYAPNVAVWASAYLAGPGFTLAGVPELPVFAGLPSRPVTGAGQALLLTPVLAGCVAGVLLARRRRRLRLAAEVRAAAMAQSANDTGRWWEAATDRPRESGNPGADADPHAGTGGQEEGADRATAATHPAVPGRVGRWLPLVGAAVLSAAAAAGVFAAVGYLAAGALGSRALASTGQVGWEYAVIAGVGVGFGAMIGAFVTTLVRR